MAKKCIQLLLISISILQFTACVDREGLAPVEEGRWQKFNLNARTYRVQSQDTLFAIAFRYDQDYQQLARLNHIRPPYTLYVGQILKLGTRTYVPARHSKQYSPIRIQPKQNFSTKPIVSQYSKGWVWPTSGRIMKRFSPTLQMKGIDIQGSPNAKIYAADSGKVAYSGNGLAGYGNLIIIKHAGSLLTAYGHNARNIVHEGQYVKKGQIIADIGKVNGQYWGVHFEVRKYGKPVDPLSYLR